MVSLDELIWKISEKSDLGEGEVRDLIKEKQEGLSGLITPEGAAHIVANELGINLFEGLVKSHDLKVENIIPGMSSVDVVGRVLRIYEPREFERTDKTKGKVCSFVIGDGTGSIRVVLWGEDCSLIEDGRITEDDIIRILRGYTKENQNGEAEIHIGRMTRVVANPKDVKQEDLPLQEDRKKKISELKEGMSSVDVVGRVLRIYEPREFEREDNSTGRVVNLVIGDDTGKARVVLWDEDVGLVENEEIKVGDVIKIRSGYVKLNLEEPEVNVGRYGKVVLSPLEMEIKEIPGLEEYSIVGKRKDVAECKEGERAEIRGAIVELYESKPVFDRGDEHGLVASIVVDDGTGNIRVVCFDRVAEILLNTTTAKVVESEDPLSILAERKAEILGKEIVVSGDVKYNEQFGRLEILARDMDLNPDPKEEVRRLLKELKEV